MAQLTSITNSEAHNFVSTAPNRKEKICAKIPGFHLVKTTSHDEAIGTWRLRYTSPVTQKRVITTIGKLSTMPPSAAAKVALEIRSDLSRGIDPKVVTEERKQESRRKHQEELARKFRTIREYLEGPYREHLKSKVEEGKHTISIITAAFVGSLLDRDMDSLKKADIHAWQSQMYSKSLAHSTVTRAFGALKTMLNHAVEHEYLSSHPLANVKLNKAPDSEQERLTSDEQFKKRRMLTEGELSAIHTGLERFAQELRAKRRNSRSHGKGHLADLENVIYPHWAIPFTLLAMHTGLRPGDLRSLTWEELNISFARLIKTPRKTRHHVDPVQVRHNLNKKILEVMTVWHRQQGKPTNGLVFPSTRTGKTLSKKSYVKPWQQILHLGEAPNHLDFYCLRHHFISDLVANGVPLLYVAKLAGHKSTTMIERNYGHLSPDHASEALRQLGERLSA